MKKIILVLSAFLLAANLQAQLSLQHAVEKALGQNKAIAAAERNTAAKQASVSSAKGRYLPTVNFDISYSYIDRDIIIDLSPIRSAMIEIQSGNQVAFSNIESILQTGNPLSQEQAVATKLGAKAALDNAIPQFEKTLKERAFPKATVSLSQPIFTGGKINAGVEAAKSQLDMEIEKSEAEKDAIIVDVINYYLNVLIASENLKVRKDALNTIENHNKRAEAMLAQGLIAPHDKLRADVALSEAKRNLFEAEQLLEISRIALSSIINENSADDISDELIFTSFDKDINYFLQLAVCENHIIKQINAGASALKQKANAERANYFPTIYGFGMYDVFDNYRSAIDPKWAVGIGAQFTIFNGLRRSNDYQAARNEADALSYVSDETQRKIELAVRKLFMQTQLAAYQYEMLQSSLNQAEENFRLNEKRYVTGLGTSLELLDAELSYEAVRLKKIQTLKEYYGSIAQLYNICGQADAFIHFWNNK